MTIPVQARDEAALQASLDLVLASRPGGQDGVWLFVYGVLAAGPPFAYRERRKARLPGLRRSFCLHDPFNRGTAQAPGLVLGLEPGDGCDGLAYWIGEEDLREALSAVWRQEMRFPCYDPVWQEASFQDGVRTILVFDTNRRGPFYWPETDEARTADHIAVRAGPAGTNQAYLDETALAFADGGVVDPYLERLRTRSRPLAAALPAEPVPPETPRPLHVLVISGSARRLDGCPGLDSKARALMHRMVGRLPPGWQVDHEDIGNEHGRPKIQGCNGCVGSSMALCVWPCNCYGPGSETQPDLLWDLDLYRRLARADAWAFIGPVWWYGPTTNFKAMFDRLVCMSGGNPRPDLIDKKNTQKAQALERSPQWRELSRNHLEGRTAAFFCYGNQGANEIGPDLRPRILDRKAWFDPAQEPPDERDAYEGLVWQCRYSGIEVPDELWRYATFGIGKPYADDQADNMAAEEASMAAFDAWVDSFVSHAARKGPVPGLKEAEQGARSTTNV